MLERVADQVDREANYLRTALRLVSRIRDVKPHKEHTVPDVFEHWVRERPHNVALVFREKQYTYREYDEHANRYARWAREQGIKRGEVVALLMGNQPDFLFAWMGILKIGGVCAFINNNLAAHPLAHTLRTSEARHVIVGADALEHWASAAPLLEPRPQAWVVDTEDPAHAPEGTRALLPELARMSPAPLPARIRAGIRCSELALYLYTSGTTGLPKAARISHLRALNMMHAFAAVLGSDSFDRIYITLPLYHATGGVGGVGAALSVGAAIVLRDKFSASHFWSDLVRYRCTMFMYIGELCRYLVNTPEHPDERRHRIRACMGNGLRPEVWPEFEQRFRLPKIVEFYGSSEGNVVFFNVDNKVGSIGRLPPYMRQIFNVRIVKFDVEKEEVVRGPDGHCIECAPGEAGEAIGRISEIMPGARFEGYTKREATEKKILRNAFKPGDRWFRTGDLLSYDEEGFYYFVDRIGDTFRWKGENVSTNEVAEVLSAFRGVREVNVYGVHVPGADGRAGMAALVLDGELDAAGLHAHVAKELASFAQPLFLRLQEKLEVTGTFKQRKVELVEEGFDPEKISDPLYFRDDSAGRYVSLDRDLYEAICAGRVRI